MSRVSPLVAFLATGVCSVLAAQTREAPGTGWPTYGGDAGGLRYSASTQITRDNLSHLQPVWTFHTHALDTPSEAVPDASFEATPVLAGRTLFVSTPFDVVFALDAATGRQVWTYDPHIAPIHEGNIVTSRGVALWHADLSYRTALQTCLDRVFLGTMDGRLLSIDAATGQPCHDFGNAGEIDLKQGVHYLLHDTYAVTSPPTVIGNVVVVGSLINDNQQVDPESGVVRGFDAVTGRQIWAWEPLPWAAGQKIRTGAANTWSVISADPDLGLIYLPTGSAAPDYYGGLRPGDGRDADSVVALDARTGRKVWAFQAVHHDLWDYDIAAQPLLFTFRGHTPAIAITTKMGLVFVLDRRTGEPLYPIHERAVPQTDVTGEVTSPTQPFQDLPPLSSYNLAATDPSISWHRSPEDQEFCRRQIDYLRNDGIYTPPSVRGSVMFPGNLGGVNWGSAALDPATGILYANTNRVPFQARLIPRHSLQNLLPPQFWLVGRKRWAIAAVVALLAGTLLSRRQRGSLLPGPMTLAITLILLLPFFYITYITRHSPPINAPQLSHFGHDVGGQRGTPYLVQRDVLTDTHHHPCSQPPWGVISAINLNTGAAVWQQPLGSAIPGEHTGIANFGGPIVTQSGLVFDAAAEDPYLRAFDAATGRELWQHPLPVPAQSTPMTYTLDGRQYLVIAAGGHGDKATPLGDSLIAFALQ